MDDLRRVYISPISHEAVRLSGYCEFGSRYPPLPSSTSSSNSNSSSGGGGGSSSRSCCCSGSSSGKMGAIPKSLLQQAASLLPSGYLKSHDSTDIKVHTL